MKTVINNLFVFLLCLIFFASCSSGGEISEGALSSKFSCDLNKDGVDEATLFSLSLGTISGLSYEGSLSDGLASELSSLVDLSSIKEYSSLEAYNEDPRSIVLGGNAIRTPFNEEQKAIIKAVFDNGNCFVIDEAEEDEVSCFRAFSNIDIDLNSDLNQSQEEKCALSQLDESESNENWNTPYQGVVLCKKNADSHVTTYWRPLVGDSASLTEEAKCNKYVSFYSLVSTSNEIPEETTNLFLNDSDVPVPLSNCGGTDVPLCKKILSETDILSFPMNAQTGDATSLPVSLWPDQTVAAGLKASVYAWRTASAIYEGIEYCPDDYCDLYLVTLNITNNYQHKMATTNGQEKLPEGNPLDPGDGSSNGNWGVFDPSLYSTVDIEQDSISRKYQGLWAGMYFDNWKAKVYLDDASFLNILAYPMSNVSQDVASGVSSSDEDLTTISISASVGGSDDKGAGASVSAGWSNTQGSTSTNYSNFDVDTLTITGSQIAKGSSNYPETSFGVSAPSFSENNITCQQMILTGGGLNGYMDFFETGYLYPTFVADANAHSYCNFITPVTITSGDTSIVKAHTDQYTHQASFFLIKQKSDIECSDGLAQEEFQCSDNTASFEHLYVDLSYYMQLMNSYQRERMPVLSFGETLQGKGGRNLFKLDLASEMKSLRYVSENGIGDCLTDVGDVNCYHLMGNLDNLKDIGGYGSSIANSGLLIVPSCENEADCLYHQEDYSSYDSSDLKAITVNITNTNGDSLPYTYTYFESSGFAPSFSHAFENADYLNTKEGVIGGSNLAANLGSGCNESHTADNLFHFDLDETAFLLNAYIKNKLECQFVCYIGDCMFASWDDSKQECKHSKDKAVIKLGVDATCKSDSATYYYRKTAILDEDSSLCVESIKGECSL